MPTHTKFTHRISFTKCQEIIGIFQILRHYGLTIYEMSMFENFFSRRHQKIHDYNEILFMIVIFFFFFFSLLNKQTMYVFNSNQNSLCSVLGIITKCLIYVITLEASNASFHHPRAFFFFLFFNQFRNRHSLWKLNISSKR